MTEGIPKKTIIVSIVLSCAVLGIIFLQSVSDKRTTMVFCDVGQGDAAYIRIHNRIDVLIDSGPDKKVLLCLGKYMPFYDKTIEYAFLTHPEKDHYGGYLYILERYQVKRFFTSSLSKNTSTYLKLKKIIKAKKIKTSVLASKDKLVIYNDTISIHWPKKGIKTNEISQNKANDYSLVFSFREKGFSGLFTGDATSDVLDGLSPQSIQNTTVLKIPHHGSKNGLSKKFLTLADPQVSVISVGKNNSYGHPSQKVMEILKASKTKIRRTDEEGDIVFKITN